jgi:hypothetical protein
LCAAAANDEIFLAVVLVTVNILYVRMNSKAIAAKPTSELEHFN